MKFVDTDVRDRLICPNEQADPKQALISMGRGRCYFMNCLAPTAKHPGLFALSVQCGTYGSGCIRSFYLDYYGVIHGRQNRARPPEKIRLRNLANRQWCAMTPYGHSQNSLGSGII
jgi:hypothetical protein